MRKPQRSNNILPPISLRICTKELNFPTYLMSFTSPNGRSIENCINKNKREREQSAANGKQISVKFHIYNHSRAMFPPNLLFKILALCEMCKTLKFHTRHFKQQFPTLVYHVYELTAGMGSRIANSFKFMAFLYV